jgi:hypothetical protein
MSCEKDSAQSGEEHGSLEKEVTSTRKTSLEGDRATGTGGQVFDNLLDTRIVRPSLRTISNAMNVRYTDLFRSFVR